MIRSEGELTSLSSVHLKTSQKREGDAHGCLPLQARISLTFVILGPIVPAYGHDQKLSSGSSARQGGFEHVSMFTLYLLAGRNEPDSFAEAVKQWSKASLYPYLFRKGFLKAGGHSIHTAKAPLGADTPPRSSHIRRIGSAT